MTPRTQQPPPMLRPTRIEVDLDAIRHNVARFAEHTGTEVCAVVKGDGYGHGAVPVARAALAGGASWLAVALVEEGLALRRAGIAAPLLVLSEPPIAAIEPLLAAELTPVVYRPPFLAALDAAARRRPDPVGIHLKFDTGMGRVGAVKEDWVRMLRNAAECRGVRVEGLMTHLARADELEQPTTEEQLAAFAEVERQAGLLGIRPRWRHAANSAGALAHPAATLDLVRPGIGIYGLSPGMDVDAADFGLRPALRLVTEVAFVKHVAAGTPISYGHRWVAPRDGWVATLPLGYADGVPRSLTNVAEVLLGGRRRPIAGTVCMDLLMVWCDQDRVGVGDEAVLIGEQGDELVRVEEWAALDGTITYEIAAQLTARLPRTYMGEGAPDHAGR
jgi:alanine racemase